MLPTTQSISKKTKGPSTRTDTSTNRTIGIGTLRNVFLVMGVLVLLSFSRIYNSSIMIAYVTESEFVPDTTDLVAANASTALVAQKKDSISASNSANPTGTGTPLQMKKLQLDIMVPVTNESINATTVPQQLPPPPPLRLCSRPRLQLAENVVKQVTFQCGGAVYYDFGQKLLKYNQASSNYFWGHRAIPFPPNKAVLFFGNSHTRQLVEAFLCQYHDLIDYGSLLTGNHNSGFVRLVNNATIHWLTNNWVAFSKKWTQDILAEIPEPRPVASFDAIVLGYINPVSQGSNYYLDMMKMASIHKTMDIHRTPVSLKSVAKDISNQTALIGVGMFRTVPGRHYDQFSLNNSKATTIIHQ
jgi:hypothetical protein